MADHFYAYSDTGTHRGVDGQVTVGTSTAGTAIELRVTDGQGITKSRLLAALEAIEYKITAGNEPA